MLQNEMRYSVVTGRDLSLQNTAFHYHNFSHYHPIFILDIHRIFIMERLLLKVVKQKGNF